MGSIDALLWQAQAPLVDVIGLLSKEAKIKKVALATFAAISSLFAIGLCTVSFSSSFLSLPLFGLSFLFFKVASRLKDYDNFAELQIMKQEAKNLDFFKLIQDHQGIEPILVHEIISHSELRLKFQSELKGRSLAKLLEDIPLSSIIKHHLLKREEIRNLFYQEILKTSQASDLYTYLGDMVLNELKRFEVISLSEYEAFAALQLEEEELEVFQRSKLLNLASDYLGRREFILSILEEKYKKEKESLLKMLSRKKLASTSAVRSLRWEIKAIEQEKSRVENDPLIGSVLQTQYEAAKNELSQTYLQEKKKLVEKFSKIKSLFV